MSPMGMSGQPGRGASTSGAPAKPFTAGGYKFSGSYFTQPQVDAIRATNQARQATQQLESPLVPQLAAPAPPTPANSQPVNPETVRPISPAGWSQLQTAGRGSGVIDPTRTATPPGTVDRWRSQFGDPGVAGYNAVKLVAGKNLAAFVPGARPPLGYKPDALQALGGLATMLPTVRAAGALYTGVRAVRAGSELLP